eukprot:435059_1
MMSIVHALVASLHLQLRVAMMVQIIRTLLVKASFITDIQMIMRVKRCLCNDENDILCETGWKNIFDNQLLKYPFLESWHSYLSDAWDDTSRYVTPDSATCTANSIQYLSARCPSADCGNKGSTWEGVE